MPVWRGRCLLRSGRARAWGDAALFAALWLLSEWTRGWAFTGFPWLASGYSQSPPSPLAGFAPVFGVFGVGGLLALVAAWTCRRQCSHAVTSRCWRCWSCCRGAFCARSRGRKPWARR
ncbi:hypothetical protein [Zoogloea sp.]|uniref:hypothetical protein n=1 Tax=Zoogloea sp. TaxID=49181 RepID=UPI0025E394EB|nr:hypothetical protein [Zoogloea sp.]